MQPKTSPAIAYAVPFRFPSETAHSLQVVEMCHALGQVGGEVQLWHPGREGMATEGLWQAYDILVPAATDRVILAFDPVRHLPWLRRVIPNAVYWLRDAIWAVAAGKTASRERKDLYYTRTVETALVLSSLGLPTLLEIHRIPSGARRRIVNFLSKRSSLKLSAVTEQLAERLHDLGFRDVLVAPNAVRIERFSHEPDRDNLRRELELPADNLLVGYVGGFSTMGQTKGVETLLEAFGHIHRTRGHHDAVLTCVGGRRTELARFAALAREEGLPEDVVVLRERVPPALVPAYLRACDVLALPVPPTQYGTVETSPLKLFEYMASGRPIVASDLPTTRVMLRHGVNSWLVAPGSPRALAHGIMKLLGDSDLRESLAKEAGVAVSHHTWIQRAERVLGHVGLR